MEERDDLGSRASRRLRKEGLIPGVLYGRGKKPHAFVVRERVLRSALGGPHGLHAILDVVVDDQKTAHASVVKDYQQDPLRGYITHIDLHEVRLDQPISAQVAVVLEGDSPGVKQGGVLTQLAREVTVEALPLEMPDALPLDLSETEIGATMRVSDLAIPGSVKVLDDLETVIATVSAPRLAAELEAAEAEAAEALEAAEGEEPAGEADADAEAESPSDGGEAADASDE